MNLYKIIFKHYSSDNDETGIKAMLLAEKDEQVYNWISSDIVILSSIVGIFSSCCFIAGSFIFFETRFFLLGITIDYSLHIMTHYKHNSDSKTLFREITKPLIMSCTTTAIAFLCLLFVKSDVLKDLGIFAGITVIVSGVF